MKTNRHLKKACTCLLLLLPVGVAGIAIAFGREPYRPQINPANFKAKVDHPYFPLVPGTVLKYIEKGGGETSEDEVTVTHDTKMIMGVKCIVVHDVVSENGQLKEDTSDWYAQDKQGTVWYFGETTREFKAGGAVETKGSWEAGLHGQPGIIMPANPTPGSANRQECGRNNAEDVAHGVHVE